MYEQLPIEKVEPNSWNPNVMPAEIQAKLEEGMKSLLEKAGKLPPIVVRPLKGAKGRFQIIDGFHRWSLLKKMKQPKVDAFVLDVPDDMARILTATLNYIKGEADPDKYPLLVVEALRSNPKLELEDLAKLLPETRDTLEELILASEAATDALNTVLDDRDAGGEETEDAEAPERWVNLNFSVPLEVAGLVEAELDRISERLSGKNRRMRALEYMAAMSSQTPLDELDTRIEKKEAAKKDAGPDNADFESDVVKKPKGKSVEAELKAASKKPTKAPKKKR